MGKKQKCRTPIITNCKDCGWVQTIGFLPMSLEDYVGKLKDIECGNCGDSNLCLGPGASGNIIMGGSL